MEVCEVRGCGGLVAQSEGLVGSSRNDDGIVGPNEVTINLQLEEGVPAKTFSQIGDAAKFERPACSPQEFLQTGMKVVKLRPAPE